MIVLAYDPPSQGERHQYYNKTSGQSDIDECGYDPNTCITNGGSCTAPHSYYGR